MNSVPGFHPRFISGLSGLQLPIPKYLFPAPFENASRMAYYSSLFNSIEINSSFYRIPQAATVAKWAASTLETFRFTFKLWKGITHTGGLQFCKEQVQTFFAAINYVGEKRGCLLIQLPPSLDSVHVGNLNALLGCIKEADINHKWNVAVEFRNSSWYQESIYDLLSSYQSTIVMHDIPRSRTPVVTLSSDIMYHRFHGPTGNYRDSYSEDFLNEYATCINDWIVEGKTVYVYFNNTMGDAFSNLKALNGLVHHKT